MILMNSSLVLVCDTDTAGVAAVIVHVIFTKDKATLVLTSILGCESSSSGVIMSAAFSKSSLVPYSCNSLFRFGQFLLVNLNINLMLDLIG